MRELESLFNVLQLGCNPHPPVRSRPTKKWISDATWLLIDTRAQLHKSGKLQQQQAHQLGHQIKASLQGNQQQPAANMASNIKGHLVANKPKEAWQCLKGWYCSATDRPPKPCYLTMEHLTAERNDLYARAPPLRRAFPINIGPFPIQDELPIDGKIREGEQLALAGCVWNT